MHIEKAIITKQELDSLRPFDKGLEERVMQKLRLDWNYHSNSIEGNSLTYGETKSLILHHITAQGKPLRDHFEITGHNEALLWVEELLKGERKLTENFVRELHALILKENYFKKAITPEGESTQKEIHVGEYKTTRNHVVTSTGEIFRFSEPHEVNAKMTDLLDWYNSKTENDTINPIILAAEFHYKFILIHPFDDGNGRVARILMNFILMKFGYHPAIIKKENKEEYYKVLRLADGNNIEPFIEFVAESVNESLTLMLNAIKGLPFEDDNDIDKQFWLLEQKIKGLGDEILEYKSPDIILKVINEIVIPIRNECEMQNKKLNQYYINTLVKFYVSEPASLELGGSFDTEKDISNLDLKYDVTSMKLQFLFLDFNRKMDRSFSYNYDIDFTLQKTAYTIKYKNIVINLNYGKNITGKEIKELVTNITKEHIEYIDQQLFNSTNH